jgi:MFS family permease
VRRSWRAALVDTRPFRHPAYRRLWTSSVVTAVGSQLTAVAVPKQIFDDTGSSAWVGASGGAALLPLIVFGLWGGSVADAVDRRRLLVVTNAGIAVTSLLLWLQAVTGSRSVWIVLALLMAQQACVGLNAPARGAIVPRLVPADELAAAAALQSTVTGLGFVLGPLAAGALIPVVGLPTLYLIDTVALLVALVAVRGLPPVPPAPTPDGGRRATGVASVVDGVRYLSTRGVLLVSFLADIIAMVLGMPRALFPEMAERTFGDPPGGGLALGVLYAAIPAGSMLAGFFSGSFTRLHRQGAAVAVAVGCWGLAVVGFGLSGSLRAAAVFLAIGGAADMVSMVFRGALLQQAATDEMRGRMQGVFTVVVSGGPRLADLLHGTLGQALGTRAAVTGGGLLVVAAMTTVALWKPEFWRYRPEPVVESATGR